MLFTVYYLTMYNCENYAPYFTSLLSLAVCIHYIILSPFLLDSWFQLISITKKFFEKNTCLVVNSYIIHSFIISFFIHLVLKSENCVYGHIKASKRSMTISVKSYLRLYSNSLRLLFYYYISPLNKKVKSFKMTQPILKCLLFIVTSYKNPPYYINLSSSLVNSYAIFQSNIINLKKSYSQMEYWVEDCPHQGRDAPPPAGAGPPPPPPLGLGTFLYPTDSDHFNNHSSIEQQLAEISRFRQTNEKDGLLCMKGRDYKAFRNRFQTSSKYCETCSEAVTKLRPYMKAVYHKHGSSKLYRVNAPIDYWGAYLCLSCHQSPHRIKVGMRMPILISSSTMHNWMGRRYENGYKGDDLHCDVLTVPGATINVIEHALEAEYGLTYRPLDVLAVIGLNDLLRGHHVSRIISDLRRLQSTVHRLAPPGETNSIAISTLLIPPKLADLHNNYYGNRLEDIVSLNFQIMELNESQPQDPLPVRFAPKFHSWGKCSSKAPVSTAPRYLMESLPKHRYGQWRENIPEEMLHVDDETRLRMGKATIGYFKALYGITPCLAPNKTAGLLLESSTNQRPRRLSSTQFRPRNILYSLSARERSRSDGVGQRRVCMRARFRRGADQATKRSEDNTIDSSRNGLEQIPEQPAVQTVMVKVKEHNATDLKEVCQKMIAFIGKNKAT